jgi:hypothetical protein
LLAEDTDTSTALRVADILVSDDALGTNDLTLTGADAAAFEIAGRELRLKAGTNLDFETQSTYAVTVEVDDAAVPRTPNDSTAFTLSVADVNEFDVGPVTDRDAAENAVYENAAAGTSVNITASARDADATNNGITYSLVDDAGGRFTIDANSGVLRVAAELDAERAASHVITVLAVSDDGSQSEGSFVVDVLDVNDNRPVITDNRLTVEEGGAVILTGGDLFSVDADIVATTLVYEVSGLTHGQIELVAEPGVAVTEFTQQQVDMGQVVFIHDGGELAPTYLVRVSDGVFADGPLACDIHFVNVNDAPRAGNLFLEMTTPELVGNVMAAVADSEGDSLSALLFAAPAHGTVSLDADGRFSFTPHAGFVGTDTFAYRVSDGVSTSNVGIVSIVVTPLAAPLPQPPRDESPLDGDERSSADEAKQESPDADPDEVPNGEGDAVPPDGIPRSPEQQPHAPECTAAPSEGVPPEDVQPSKEPLVGFVAPKRDVADDRPARQATRGETDRADAREHTEDGSRGAASTKDHRRLMHVGKTSRLWRDLDEFQQSVGTDLQVRNIAIGSVGTVVSGFTVGYVLWALRSGLLLTSVLASLPAWTMFDPLAIASVSGQNDDDDPEDSLEQIIKNRAALAEARTNVNPNLEP